MMLVCHENSDDEADISWIWQFHGEECGTIRASLVFLIPSNSRGLKSGGWVGCAW
jgi:hypothetical protein